MYTTQEIAQELASFNSFQNDPADHIIFFTEDSDCYLCKDIIIDQRPGLDTIKQQRWGYDQQKHGKMTRKRGTGTKYPIPERKYTYDDDLDPYRNMLHETYPEPLGIENTPLESDEVTDTEKTEWFFNGQYWESEQIPIYGIFSSTFNITGSYTQATYLKLEELQYHMRGMSTKNKLTYIEEHQELIEKDGLELTYK